MPTALLIGIVAVTVGAFTALGAYVADAKGRSRDEGAALGFLFAALGVLIEALLPAQPRE